MIKKKICAVCGKECEVFHDDIEKAYISKLKDGAKLYYEIWHFDVERCFGCNYASKDISKCLPVKVDEKEKLRILKDETLELLYQTRPHYVYNYLLAALYYKTIGDTYTQSLCVLQAGDWLYHEIMNYMDYILDDTDKEEREKLNNYAYGYYQQTIELLKSYLESNPQDFNAKLLLAGVLSDCEKTEKIQSSIILRSLQKENLTADQKKIWEFLYSDIE